VQFRLRLMDETGTILPGSVPYLMHDGYVTPMVRRFVHYAGPPGSGNFYSALAIARAFPLDAAYWRRGADTIPFVAAAFAGASRVAARTRHVPVASALAAGSWDFRQHRHQLRRGAGCCRAAPQGSLAMLRRGFGINLPGPFLPAPTDVRTRALSWRLDPENHPYPDSRVGLMRMQLDALRHWPGSGASSE